MHFVKKHHYAFKGSLHEIVEVYDVMTLCHKGIKMYDLGLFKGFTLDTLGETPIKNGRAYFERGAIRFPYYNRVICL